LFFHNFFCCTERRTGRAIAYGTYYIVVRDRYIAVLNGASDYDSDRHDKALADLKA